MTYGLQIRNAAGTIVYDSRDSMGGLFIEYLTLAYGSGGGKTYPGLDVAGKTLRWQVIQSGCHLNFTAMTDAGQPRITWDGFLVTGTSAPARATILAIYAV